MMKKRKWMALFLAVVLALTMAAGCGSSDTSTEDTSAEDSASAESADSAGEETDEEAAEDTGVTATELNIAIQPSASFLPLFIAKENGWLEEELAEYGVTVNWTSFEGGSPINESLAAGSSDIGTLGDVPTVSAIAAGQDLEIVMTTAQTSEANGVVVSVDSDIETIEDLEGKTIGTVVGSSSHNHVKKLLETVGLDIDEDITLTNISVGDASTVLINEEVDAVALWEPNITRLVAEGTARVLATGLDCDLLGATQIVARSEYAEENPTVIRIVIEQYARAVAEIDTLSGDTLTAIADYLTVDEDLLPEITAKIDYTVLIQDEDKESLNDTISFLVSIDVIDEAYDITDYYNSTYIDSADIAQYLE